MSSKTLFLRHNRRFTFGARLGILSVLLLFLVLGMWYAQRLPLNYDEGTNLIFGILARAGYTPYTDIFIGIPPLGVLTTQLAATFGENGVGARYLMLLYSLLGASTMFWLVKSQAKYSPLWTGGLAAAFLSFYPVYFFQAVFIMTDVPAVALAILSIALVERYRYRPSSGWLLLSGIVYGLSLSLKILVIFLPVIVSLQLLEIVLTDRNFSLQQKSTYFKLVKMGAAWITGILLVLVFLWVVFDAKALYQQVIAFRLIDRTDRLVNEWWWVRHNGAMLGKAVLRYSSMMVGAILGLIAVGRRGLGRVWLWLVWGILALLFLFVHVPVRSHHSVILMPPLAALSSIGVTHLPYRFKRPVWWLSLLVLLILVALTFFIVQSDVIELPDENDFLEGTGRLSTVEFIQQTTAPHEFIVVDDPRTALLAGRLIPPYLSETSHPRVSIGWLSMEDILKTANIFDSPVLIMGPRFTNIPGFAQAAHSLYSLKLLFADTDGGHTITVYAVEMNPDIEPVWKIDRSLGGQVVLRGVDITPSPWQPGQNVSLSMYWQTQQKMERDYKIFLYLKDSPGNVVLSLDHYPFETNPDYQITYILPNPAYLEGQVIEDFADYPATGLLPTRLWIPGNTLKETINVTLPAAMSPNTYTVEAGMYDPTTLERLTVLNASTDAGQDTIVLGTVEVVE